MKELAEFIKTTDSGLMKPVEEGDYTGLVDCMGYLFAVKDRQATTDECLSHSSRPLSCSKHMNRSYLRRSINNCR